MAVLPRRLRALTSHLPTPKAAAGQVVALPERASTSPNCDLGGCELDEAEYLANRLTAEERESFLSRGFILIRKGLRERDVTDLTAVLDSTHRVKLREDEARHESAMPDVMNRMAVFSPANQLSHARCTQRLLTCPAVFPKVVDILGWNISVYHAHANLSPPRLAGDVIRDGQFRPLAGLDASVSSRPPPGEEPTYGFHQDTGRVNKELERPGLTPGAWVGPRLSVKAVFYLTDVSEEAAPTWIVPGSHLQTQAEFAATLPHTQRGQPAGAVPVLANAGDVLLFDRRLRHTASPNWSASETRKGFFVGFAYRWLRPKDPMYTADILPQVQCAVTRQLLGDSWSNNGVHGPTPADAPLFVWLKDVAGVAPEETGLEGQGEGTLTAVSPGRENYGRLQGDVGKAAWSRLPEVLGGYRLSAKEHTAAVRALPRAALEKMSKEELIELALRQQEKFPSLAE